MDYTICYTLESPPSIIPELAAPLESDGNAWNGLTKANPPDRALMIVKPGKCLRFKASDRRCLRSRSTGQI